MLRNLLERCGMLVGAITPDPDLTAAADKVRESLHEWQEAMEQHNAQDEELRPPKPMRRVK